MNIITTFLSLRKLAALAAVSLGVAAAGCAHDTKADVPELPLEVGPPVSTYRIPADQPRGTLHLISLGREVLPTATGQPRVFLHLRLAAVNGSDDQSWILDPREQLLRDGDQTLAPTFSEGSTGQPLVTLPRGSRGFLDLYYPMLTSAGKEPERVALAWRLRRGDQLFARATEFERSHHDVGYAYYQPADQEHLTTAMGSRSWWWNDYYFWHDDRGWWPYQQSAFSRRYPHHREQWSAEREQRRERAEREAAIQSTDRTNVGWRGVPMDRTGNESARSETSSWRGTPVTESVSSSQVTDSSTSSSGSSGGDGKSSWRGGTGP
jgi:hypothetical protein